MTNALAYYGTDLITVIIKFYSTDPGNRVSRNFFGKKIKTLNIFLKLMLPLKKLLAAFKFLRRFYIEYKVKLALEKNYILKIEGVCSLRRAQ
jgi:hypothetical protein